MRYVLDSNIILFYVRDSKTKRFIENQYHPFDEENTAIISIATVAELMSLAKRQKWGERKRRVLQRIFDSLTIVEIRYSDLIEAYSDIDTYSHGKDENRPLGMTSRNMGKNDLWIAATAHITNSKLLTTDKDFNHLNGVFFDIILIEQQ